MRLFPILIVIIIAVIAIKGFSIVFDQTSFSVEVAQVSAAEGDLSEEDQKAAAREAQKNLDIERKKVAAEREMIANNVDVLLDQKQESGTKEFFTDSEIELLQSLKERRDLLDDRERKIDLQAKLLKAAEQQLDNKIAKLTALEEIIKQKLGEVNEKEIARFASLVKTYESMKPKDAAKILSILDLPIMEKITRSMNTKKLAPILAKMDMKAARALTIRLAQPPEEMKMEDLKMPKMQPDKTSLPELTLE